MSGPLSSVRVVDFTENMAGPFGTMILGDQGADIIKVESLRGDALRTSGTGSAKMGAYFANLNRSKRSLAIDLQRPEGRMVLDALFDSADVVVQSFRPLASQRLGLDAASVLPSRPSLIHASIFGYGAAGPLAGRPVYDHVMQAASGMADLQRESGEDEPHLIRHGLVDKSTGYVLAQSVCAALVERYQTGQGTSIEINMLDVAISLLWPDGMMDRTALQPERRLPAAALTFRLTPTIDGHVAIVVLTKAQWQGLVTACNIEETTDGRSDSTTSTAEPGMILRQARAYIAKLSTDEVVRRLSDNDVPCAAVVSLDNVATQPQVLENGTLVEYEHPVIGRIRQPRPVPQLPSMRNSTVIPAPVLGENSRSVLDDIGLSTRDIDGLIAAGIVAEPIT